MTSRNISFDKDCCYKREFGIGCIYIATRLYIISRVVRYPEFTVPFLAAI